MFTKTRRYPPIFIVAFLLAFSCFTTTVANASPTNNNGGTWQPGSAISLQGSNASPVTVTFNANNDPLSQGSTCTSGSLNCPLGFISSGDNVSTVYNSSRAFIISTAYSGAGNGTYNITLTSYCATSQQSAGSQPSAYTVAVSSTITLDSSPLPSSDWNRITVCSSAAPYFGYLTIQDFNNSSGSLLYWYPQGSTLVAHNPPVSCTDISEIQSSYVGTSLSVKVIQIPGVPTPTAFQVYVPGVASTVLDNAYPSPTMTIIPNDAVAGQPQTYYKSITLSTAPSAMTFSVGELSSDGTVVHCALSGSILTNQISNTNDSDTGSGVDASPPISSTSCGWTINILKILKCLFWPSDMTGWSSRIDSIKTKPPVNIMVGGYGLVTSATDWANNCTNNGNASELPSDCDNQPAYNPYQAPFGANGSEVNFDIIDSAHQWVETSSEGTLYYQMVVIALWVGFAIIVWHRISKSFGDKQDDN